MSKKGITIMDYKVKTAEERLQEQKAKQKAELERKLVVVHDIVPKIDKYMDDNPNDKNWWSIETTLLSSFNENYNANDHLSIIISLYKKAGYEVSYNEHHKSLIISIEPKPTVKRSDYCAHETF